MLIMMSISVEEVFDLEERFWSPCHIHSPPNHKQVIIDEFRVIQAKIHDEQ